MYEREQEIIDDLRRARSADGLLVSLVVRGVPMGQAAQAIKMALTPRCQECGGADLEGNDDGSTYCCTECGTHTDAEEAFRA